MDSWIRRPEEPANLTDQSNSLNCKFEIATFVYTEGLPDVVRHKDGRFITVAKNKNFNGFGILGVIQLRDAITRDADAVLFI